MNRYVHSDTAELVLSGDDYFERLSNLIDTARQVIHIQTYIIEGDVTGKSIVEKLISASGRGVAVFFLADAFGSKNLPAESIKRMKDSGIQFRFFSPLFSSEGIYLGRRLHHKIAVADNSNALIGGINIADKYHGTNEEYPWLDFAVLIRGNCCRHLQEICEGIFGKKRIYHWVENENGTGPLVRFRRNDWIRGKNDIHKSYREALHRAEKEVTIIGSYFLPGFWFRKLLKRTAERGVKVRLIVTGKTDVPVVHLAEKYIYSHLVRSGIELYEWADSVMHGKAMIIDGEWSTIGSYNVNYLSHYRSIELNAEIQDRTFAGVFTALINNILDKQCVRMNMENFQKRSGALYKLKMQLAYFFLFTIIPFILPKRRVYA